MAFDKSTRNRLASFVGEARRLLADEFTQKFQSIYGISDKGIVTPLEQLGHLDESGLATAALLRDRIEYLIRTHPDDKDGAKAAVDRLAREQAFTILNRLAAIRMAEKRGLIVESVGQGYQSKGFKVFEQIAGSGLGDIYHRYRRYLFCLFDELSVDLGSLFDRRSPQALLFPREPALLGLLELINSTDIDSLWVEDETIGWIYQYYNDPAERKKMRDESASPRNSRELAVRNQFFTPRYVVEFLTDNTLGRIWFEMTKGETCLKESCRYLVRRPTEIFLKYGEKVPEQSGSDQNLSQQELLEQPVHIQYRPLKDPRTLRMLDPACGSMHFGLYAFDLYEQIYDEAWELEVRLGAKALVRDNAFKPLTESYSDKGAFIQDVPRLIIEHNIHGIDIDPRAAQIAGLSLWLRAQKSWHEKGVKTADRPHIKRSNIVCAEPMPGDKKQLHQFTSTLEIPALSYLIKQVFDKMELAGEAGSLLKIEEEIRQIIANAKKIWEEGSKLEQMELFADFNAKHDDSEITLNLTGINDAFFWEGVEDRLYSALKDYSEVVNDSGYQRRLFAEDAARGFAFIDICRNRYDVVLMNPPFGYPSEISKKYIDIQYPNSKYDVLACFVERWLNSMFTDGRLGSITSRTVYFIEYFCSWRTRLLFNNFLAVFVDLGLGVLDAMVETAACVIEPREIKNTESVFVRLLSESDKPTSLLTAIENMHTSSKNNNTFIAKAKDFEAIEGCPLAYWVPNSFRAHFKNHKLVKEALGDVRVGLQTGDDFRFVRAVWEIPLSRLGMNRKWKYLAKGGEFRKFYDDIHLVVNWDNNGNEVINFIDDAGKQRSRPQNVHYYYRKGITYPMRTRSSYSPRVLPSECIFNVQGNSIFQAEDKVDQLYSALGVLSSMAFESFTRLKARVGDMTTAGGAGFTYTPGLIGTMPFPELNQPSQNELNENVLNCINSERLADIHEEPSNLFVLPLLINTTTLNLKQSFMIAEIDKEKLFISMHQSVKNIETIVQDSYQFNESDKLEVETQFGIPLFSISDTNDINTEDLKQLYTSKNRIDDVTSEQSQQKKVASDRYLNLDEICRLYQINPKSFVKIRQENNWYRHDCLTEAVFSLIQYTLGCSLGRWDICYATGEKSLPEMPDPFSPLPSCCPGMLQNLVGYPAEINDLPIEYPLRISWPGILVDDESHSEDIVSRVREAVEVIWKERAEAIEQEACEILSVRSLRDYFRRPAAFFTDHLKRYSKSRRQAPIYWPLSTKSGSYTLWLYYYRITDQTLHTCLADFLDPKIRKVQSEFDALTASGQGGIRSGELRELLDELKDLRDEIERIIKLPWKPNLNDGVLITASPLWKLFRLPKWQKDLKNCWEGFEKGEYDWAHLAYSIWPKRVEEVCKKDRSIAIAHSLEHLCEAAPLKAKAKRGKMKTTEEDEE